jgi:hypothetical protein
MFWSGVVGKRGQDAVCGGFRRLLQRREEGTGVETHKWKGGLDMAKEKITPKQLQEVRELAREWGKIVSRRAFGAGGPDATIDFHTMEALAAAAAQGVTEGTLDTLLHQQAGTLDPQHPCPGCGTLCPVETEERPLTVPHAKVSYQEPVCHCPSCRKDFFPPPGRPRP